MTVIWFILSLIGLFLIASILDIISGNKGDIRELQYKLLFLEQKSDIKKLAKYYKADSFSLNLGEVLFLNRARTVVKSVSIYNIERKLMEYQNFCCKK